MRATNILLITQVISFLYFRDGRLPGLDTAMGIGPHGPFRRRAEAGRGWRFRRQPLRLKGA